MIFTQNYFEKIFAYITNNRSFQVKFYGNIFAKLSTEPIYVRNVITISVIGDGSQRHYD